ncbi:MAG TPA: sugar kinase [Gammaproteobacteria bacterium]|nr:sugar kinase [Gammaproteobacteria bacterium]
MPTVVCSGETMALLTPPHNGRLRHAAHVEIRVGGAESTVAIALNRLGIAAGWASRLGRDELGELVVSRIRAEGVDVAAVTRHGSAPTGLYLRQMVGDRMQTYYYRRGSAASHLDREAFDPGYLDGARFLHLTGITPALSESCRTYVHWAVDEARRRGVAVSFDVNFRSKLWDASMARDCLDALLPDVDVLFVSDEEASALWGRSDDGLLRSLADRGPEQIILKRGAAGCRARIGEQYLEQPAFTVPVVDTTGAGDAFAAGYLAGCLWSQSPDERLRTALAMGAYGVMGRGDYEDLPDREELEQFVAGRHDMGR